MTEPQKGVAAIVAACSIWGLATLYYHALDHVPPLEMMAHRTVWTALSFAALLAAQGNLGALAVLWRSPLGAGASGACLGSLALRTASASHGPVVGLMGATVAGVVALLLFAVVHRRARLVDDDGRMEARPLCLHLTLTVCIAATWTVPAADLIGWGLR